MILLRKQYTDPRPGGTKIKGYLDGIQPVPTFSVAATDPHRVTRGALYVPTMNHSIQELAWMEGVKKVNGKAASWLM